MEETGIRKVMLGNDWQVEAWRLGRVRLLRFFVSGWAGMELVKEWVEGHGSRTVGLSRAEDSYGRHL